jgi:hypothetical protein
MAITLRVLGTGKCSSDILYNPDRLLVETLDTNRYRQQHGLVVFDSAVEEPHGDVNADLPAPYERFEVAYGIRPWPHSMGVQRRCKD